MDPQQFANAIERYIESLDDEEPPEDNLLQLGNGEQHDFYVPTGEDEVDLVDGQPNKVFKKAQAVKRKFQQPVKKCSGDDKTPSSRNRSCSAIRIPFNSTQT